MQPWPFTLPPKERQTVLYSEYETHFVLGGTGLCPKGSDSPSQEAYLNLGARMNKAIQTVVVHFVFYIKTTIWFFLFAISTILKAEFKNKSN